MGDTDRTNRNKSGARLRNQSSYLEEKSRKAILLLFLVYAYFSTTILYVIRVLMDLPRNRVSRMHRQGA